MPANKMLERIRRGEKALGLSLSFPSEEMVELAGRLGLDFVAFDGQHSAMTTEIIEGLCRVADGYGVTPMARVPDHRESTLLNYLDRGIKTVVCPNLETKGQAESLVRYCNFAPEGVRSFTSLRVVEFDLGGSSSSKQLMADTNATTLIVPQLESITAINNIDEILSVDGIKVFGWGSNDLAQSMGHVGEPGHPEVLAAQDRALEKIHAAGKMLLQEITESIPVIGCMRDAAQKLLKDHGR